MISSALPGSKRGISVSIAPKATATFIAQVCPKAWNSGSAPRITSSSVTCTSVIPVTSALRRRFSCVSSAPLGVPVVPEV